MSEKRFTWDGDILFDSLELRELGNCLEARDIVDLLNELNDENEQLKNELRKEKSLREYSDSMYGADLIVNIRFSNGEWKADVSVIDDE